MRIKVLKLSKLNSRYLFLIVIISSCLITYISQEIIISDEIFRRHLIQQLDIVRIELILGYRRQWAWVNYAILPIIYLLKFTIISLWLLCGIILFGYKTTFKKIFGVVLISEFIWILPSLISIIWFVLIDSEYTLSDLQYFQPLSLMNFFNGEQVETWLVLPLKSLNLFQVAYMLVLALGIRRLINRDYNTSLSFVVPTYGLGLITWIVFITFISINLSS